MVLSLLLASLHEVSKEPDAGDLRQAAGMRGWVAGETQLEPLGAQSSSRGE